MTLLLILLLLLLGLFILRQLLHIELMPGGKTRIAWKSDVREAEEMRVRAERYKEAKEKNLSATRDVVSEALKQEFSSGGKYLSEKFFWPDGRPLRPGDVVHITDDMEVHELPGEPRRWIIGKRR